MANLIFGCGYLGRRVGRRWITSGTPVFVTTRSKTRGIELADEGYEPIILDVTKSPLPALPVVETILWSVGFDRSVGKHIDEVYVQGLRNTLDRIVDRCRRFIYISSTGVYSQTHGQRVDEQSVCRPQRENGRACLSAERLLQQHAVGKRAIILRLAGIYGPGRIPRAADVRAGIPITGDADGFLNLIHVDDAVSAVCAAESSALVPELYVVSDGHPVQRRDYYHQVAALLKALPPQFQPPREGSAKAERGLSSKRAINEKMLRQLGVDLQYPTYRDGLAAALSGGSGAS